MTTPSLQISITTRKSFPATGMTCAGCALRVESMLKSAKGVGDAALTLPTKLHGQNMTKKQPRPQSCKINTFYWLRPDSSVEDYGILLSPAIGAVLMSQSTVIVAISTSTLHIKKQKIDKFKKSYFF